MRDNELIALVGTTLQAACQSAGFTNYTVLQVQGPTQQGAPSGPSVLFQKLFDDTAGWSQEELTYNPPTPERPQDDFTDASIQNVVTHFQISGLVKQQPDDTDLPTASDVVNYMHQYITARHTIRQFQAQGLGIMRVSQVRNDYFEDDSHRNEAHPMFDVQIAHRRQVDFSVGAAHVVDGTIQHVPDNPVIPPLP